MKLIICDYEIFKYDTLFGCIVIDENGEKLYQLWDLELIKNFFQCTKDDSIYVNWNGKYYDNTIMDAIMSGKNPYLISKKIINNERVYSNLSFYHYDVMNTGFGCQLSLKLTELISGKSIDTTEVDFDLDRPLTEEEKQLTEKYNQSDLYQTLYNFKKIYDRFELRLGMIKDWNLDLAECLDMTGAQIASKVLLAKKDISLEYQKVKPILYDNLIIENDWVKDFYLNEKFKTPGMKQVTIGNADLSIGAGGLHQALKKVFYKRLLYLDVSGYYNLVMINFNLLSRAIPEEGKKRYKMMYDQQIALKKIDPDSPKRKQFKTVLLSVFGAQGHKGSDMYDPEIGGLVPVVGEVFLIDLMEKIYTLCEFVQSNTDGIMIYPNSDEDEKKILEILDAWLKRTGFVIKPKYIYNLFQRDVNNYMYQDEHGNIEVKGEALKNYDFSDKAYSAGTIFDCKEPPIIAKGIVNALMFDKLPEETVEELKDDFKLFQYACKKNTFDYLTYDLIDKYGNQTSVSAGGICRAFAWNDKDFIGMVNKHKKTTTKDKIAKVASLPPSVFLYNKDLFTEDAKKYLEKNIDYNYYIERIYERIGEFI